MIAQQDVKKKADAAKRWKKMPIPSITPHTTMSTSKGNKDQIGESSQPKKSRTEVVDIPEETEENEASFGYVVRKSPDVVFLPFREFWSKSHR